MTVRIRTKFLAFPAICVFFAALLSLAGLDIVRSNARLLERSERDLLKTQRLTVLFDQLSRNHGAIYDVLADAGQGLEEERVYELGQPLLDNVRGLLKNVDDLPAAHAFGTDELRLHAILVQTLRAYALGATGAVERSAKAKHMSRWFMKTANAEFASVSQSFALLIEESRRSTDAAIDAEREALAHAREFRIGGLHEPEIGRAHV